MSWTLTPFGKTRTPLYGVPWRDLSDEEFAAAEEVYPELRERGYFAAGEQRVPTSRTRRITRPPASPNTEEVSDA